MVVKKGNPMLASDILDLTFFPVGSILMMDGSWTDGRGGWYICDGRNTQYGKTPDLRDKFIKGGTASGATGGGQVTLTTDNLPPHSHPHKFTGGIYAAGTFPALAPVDTILSPLTSYTESVGRGIPFDVIPSYYSVIYIKKMV